MAVAGLSSNHLHHTNRIRSPCGYKRSVVDEIRLTELPSTIASMPSPHPASNPAHLATTLTKPSPHLSAADPKLGRLIERAGPFTLSSPARSPPSRPWPNRIIYQQLHGKAAATIHRRLSKAFHPVCGIGAHPSPQHLLDCPNEQLRAAGLSGNKALALRDLAAKTLDGTVPTLARIRRMSDDDIIEHLVQVRGIGRWTVEMLLIFRLGRPDVLPVDDYGVRKGFALTFQGLKPDRQGHPRRPPQTRRHAQTRRTLAALALRRQLVHVARLRSRRRQSHTARNSRFNPAAGHFAPPRPSTPLRRSHPQSPPSASLPLPCRKTDGDPAPSL